MMRTSTISGLMTSLHRWSNRSCNPDIDLQPLRSPAWDHGNANYRLLKSRCRHHNRRASAPRLRRIVLTLLRTRVLVTFPPMKTMDDRNLPCLGCVRQEHLRPRSSAIPSHRRKAVAVLRKHLHKPDASKDESLPLLPKTLYITSAIKLLQPLHHIPIHQFLTCRRVRNSAHRLSPSLQPACKISSLEDDGVQSHKALTTFPAAATSSST